VADDDDPVGLEPDYATLRKPGKDDGDLLQLALHQAVINAVGAAAATNVTSDIHTVAGADVCRVHVKPSAHPVHATVTPWPRTAPPEGRPVLRVRIGNGTREITDEHEQQKYIAGRWGKAACRSSTYRL